MCVCVCVSKGELQQKVKTSYESTLGDRANTWAPHMAAVCVCELGFRLRDYCFIIG